MSVFKTKAVVLKIDKINKWDFIYTILTYDFWKIRVSKKKYKKEKSLDLGYIVNCEIRTSNIWNIHKIWNIKIVSEFSYECKGFSEISSFLELLALVNNNIPERVIVFEIFNIIESINIYKNITKDKITLSKIKVLNKLWVLKLEHKNETVQRILKFIDQNYIKNILRLTWITDSMKMELERVAVKI